MHEKIYETLVSILGLKFKTQLKGTDIHFQNLYQMKNLITTEQDYLLIFDDRKTIRFSNKIDFLKQLISIVNLNINVLNEEFKELQQRERNDAIIDENEIFLQHEHIGYCGDRLSKLLNKLKDFLKKEQAN